MYQVSVDIGGTFTDVVVVDRRGEPHMFKSPTTPPKFEEGFMDVLDLAARSLGQTLETFLTETSRIVHGSTIGTNTLVEGRGDRVGFICNSGHPDILTIREAPRKRAFEWHLDYPEPYVPRMLTEEVHGRISAEGQVIEPLDEDSVRDAIGRLRLADVEALAVCLLWSPVNPSHERRVSEIIADMWPEVPVSLSHTVNPILREYRRAIATVIDASLRRTVSSYVDRLTARLRENGFQHDVLMANCLGGMMLPADIVSRPILSVMSGPTLAPVAASRITNEKDIIVVDMGGTTFDTSAIRNGQLVIANEAMIGPDLLGIPKVDVRSVGAGGGSIAWVDSGGLLRVGPKSAGADPGPVCFGRGGRDPTVTDANIVLGILDPQHFLGGRMIIDFEAALRAMEALGKSLGMGGLEVAHAVHTTCNHNMIAAIEDITVRDGIDPRESYIVCAGGATASHVAEMAQILGISRYMVPRFAPVLSAFGGLVSDIRWEGSMARPVNSASFDRATIDEVLSSLAKAGNDFLNDSGVEDTQRSFEYAVLARYHLQSWDIEVPFQLTNGKFSESEVMNLIESFHTTHERIYTIRQCDESIDFRVWKVRAVGQVGISTDGIRQLDSTTIEPRATTSRQVYIRELGGQVELPIFREPASANSQYHGPCIIEGEVTTVFLLPCHVATVDRFGNLLIEIKH